MKTFQCKKSLLAVGLAAALASITALADAPADNPASVYDSGLQPNNASVNFDVTADVAAVVEIALGDAHDLYLGVYDPLNPSTTGYINNVCLYSNTGAMTVHAHSDNMDSVNSVEADLIKDGGGGGPDDVIPYQFTLLDSPDGSAGSPIQTLIGNGGADATLLSGSSVVSTVPCGIVPVSQSQLASFQVTTDSPHDTFPTFGLYRDTITVTVDPIM